jgi:hypothetical protein
VASIHDPKVGVIFDPPSLIQALTDMISEHVHQRLPHQIENVKTMS